MTAPSPDPLTGLSWRERWSLRRQLRRSWRMGMAERNHDTLERLRTQALGGTPVRVDDEDGVADIVFPDGTIVRMGPCHRPAIRALRSAVRDGGVYLAQASHHGRCWGLYFVGAGPSTSPRRFPLLALEVRVRRDGGGGWAAPQRSVPRVPALV